MIDYFNNRFVTFCELLDQNQIGSTIG